MILVFLVYNKFSHSNSFLYFMLELGVFSLDLPEFSNLVFLKKNFQIFSEINNLLISFTG